MSRSNINESDNNNSKEIYYEDLGNINFVLYLFEQCYETPYIPSENIIKIQFMSYYNEEMNINDNNTNESFKGVENIRNFK